MGELIVASGNAAPVLEAAESALNDIPGSIGDCVNGMLVLAGRVGGDDRLAAPVPQSGTEGVAVGGGIGQAAGRRQGGHPGQPDQDIPTRARAEDQPPGAPGLIDGGRDFGRSAPPRPPDHLLLRPPFPPAAARDALTGVASSSSAGGGPPTPARRVNTPSQTPFRAQRTNRLYRGWDGP